MTTPLTLRSLQELGPALAAGHTITNHGSSVTIHPVQEDSTMKTPKGPTQSKPPASTTNDFAPVIKDPINIMENSVAGNPELLIIFGDQAELYTTEIRFLIAGQNPFKIDGLMFYAMTHHPMFDQAAVQLARKHNVPLQDSEIGEKLQRVHEAMSAMASEMDAKLGGKPMEIPSLEQVLYSVFGEQMAETLAESSGVRTMTPEEAYAGDPDSPLNKPTPAEPAVTTKKETPIMTTKTTVFDPKTVDVSDLDLNTIEGRFEASERRQAALEAHIASNNIILETEKKAAAAASDSDDTKSDEFTTGELCALGAGALAVVGLVAGGIAWMCSSDAA